MAPQARPFRWKGLPKYSRESAALLGAFTRYLGSSPFGPALLGSVASAAREILKTDVEIYFDHLRTQTYDELATSFPEHAALVRIGLEPQPEKIIWELDPVLAAMSVDRLLSGKGDDAGLSRDFTDIEQGVLTYALLRIVQAFRTGLQEGSELAVRLEGFAQNPEVYRSLFAEDTVFHVAAYKISVGKMVAFTRLCIPHTLTAAAFSLPEEPEEGEVFLRHMRQNLARVGEQWVLARARVATLDLTNEDLEALAVGDIVLLENHQLTGPPESLQGVANVRIGRGKNGGITTQILWRNGHADLQIASIDPEQEPQDMADEGTPEPAAQVEEGGEAPEAPADNLAENEGLLRDVPAPVAVELARLKMTTAQVIRLKAGQILRLGRGPNDTVDLVVNNRVFARGELIEVDGELGVRLVQLAR